MPWSHKGELGGPTWHPLYVCCTLTICHILTECLAKVSIFNPDKHPLGYGSCFRDKDTVLAISCLADVTKRLRITVTETSSKLTSFIEKPKGELVEVNMMTLLHMEAWSPDSFQPDALPSRYPADISKSKTAAQSREGGCQERDP